MSSFNALFSAVDLGGGSLDVAVKDCLDIAGFRTIAGCAALSDSPVADRHAQVVRALLADDCRIIGKANMHELAYGVTGQNAWTGSPVNPRFQDRVPGGSSSGSAVAVAEGLVQFSIGTDTGGSIRTPAACCGIFGLKSSFGRVSRDGAWPRESTLDCIGPMARSMAMIERAMEIIAPGYRPRANFQPNIVFVMPDAVDAAVKRSVEAVSTLLPGNVSMGVLPGLEAAYAANIAVIAAETYAAFGHLAGQGRLGVDVEARLLAAASVDADRLASAEQVRDAFRREVDGLLDGQDVLILPTMPCFPLHVDNASDGLAALRMTALVRPFNLSGHPALTVPVMAQDGLPVGIQIVGRCGDDETVCAVGRMLEAELSSTPFSWKEEN